MGKKADPSIKLKKSFFDPREKQFIINADYGDVQNIGQACYASTYYSMNYNNWKLITLWVHQDYRQKGIAKQLFKAFYDDVKLKDGNRITWQVRPQASNISETQLVHYYKSMIKNIDAKLLEKTQVKEVGPLGFEVIHMSVEI